MPLLVIPPNSSQKYRVFYESNDQNVILTFVAMLCMADGVFCWNDPDTQIY